jgi:hypothetical protein
MLSYNNTTEPEPDVLSYNNATEPEPDMFSYNNAIETRTITPLRTQNEITMAALPMPNRETPMDQDQFLEQCQTNALSLWEQMVNLHRDLVEQIDQL